MGAKTGLCKQRVHWLWDLGCTTIIVGELLGAYCRCGQFWCSLSSNTGMLPIECGLLMQSIISIRTCVSS